MLSLTQSTRLSRTLKIPLMMMLRTWPLTQNLMKYAMQLFTLMEIIFYHLLSMTNSSISVERYQSMEEN